MWYLNMKKCLYLLLILSLFIFSGCTTKNKTVSFKNVNSYEKALMHVYEKYPAMYFEGTIHYSKDGGNTSELDFSIYIKGNKWKEKLTLKIPEQSDKIFNMVKNNTGTYILTNKGYRNTKDVHTIIYPIINWHNSNGIKGFGIDKKFIDNNSNVNGIACRELQYKSHTTYIKLKGEPVDTTIDMCVSDQYGVAVLYTVNYINSKGSQTDSIEIKKIEPIEIPDAIFDIQPELSVPYQMT